MDLGEMQRLRREMPRNPDGGLYWGDWRGTAYAEALHKAYWHNLCVDCGERWGNPKCWLCHPPEVHHEELIRQRDQLTAEVDRLQQALAAYDQAQQPSHEFYTLMERDKANLARLILCLEDQLDRLEQALAETERSLELRAQERRLAEEEAERLTAEVDRLREELNNERDAVSLWIKQWKAADQSLQEQTADVERLRAEHGEKP